MSAAHRLAWRNRARFGWASPSASKYRDVRRRYWLDRPDPPIQRVLWNNNAAGPSARIFRRGSDRYAPPVCPTFGCGTGITMTASACGVRTSTSPFMASRCLRTGTPPAPAAGSIEIVGWPRSRASMSTTRCATGADSPTRCRSVGSELRQRYRIQNLEVAQKTQRDMTRNVADCGLPMLPALHQQGAARMLRIAEVGVKVAQPLASNMPGNRPGCAAAYQRPFASANPCRCRQPAQSAVPAPASNAGQAG